MVLNFFPFTLLRPLVRIVLAEKIGDAGELLLWLSPRQAGLRRAAKKLALPAVKLLPVYDRSVPENAVSCLGGQPSLPKDSAWPLGENGEPMHFLAQINYADMPYIEGYPSSGLLSIFVENDDVWGLNWDDHTKGRYKALFFSDPSALRRKGVPVTSLLKQSVFSKSVLKEGLVLKGREAIGLPSASSVQTAGLINSLPDRAQDRFQDWLVGKRPSDIYYGGHPDFIQWDFRTPEEAQKIDRVLLQMGSFFAPRNDAKATWDVCWGDAGEMCLMLSDSNLREQAFDKAHYNWDCS